MALELFKPFIYSRLDAKGLSTTVKQAKKLVEKEKPEVWDILDEVIREHPVLLNRAPTLHRLGIQAFEPVLIEGKAIQLHPLVCAAFNADFDGDQMAVHVPLSLEAQLEARVLMMSTNNILHPANGSPIIVPSQDIVLGLYYLSIMREGGENEKQLKIFGEMSEIEHALHAKVVDLHTKIKYRWIGVDEKGKSFTSVVRDHAGPRDARPGAAEELEGSLRRREQAHDQAGNLRHDRPGLPPLRAEGDGDLLRPHHGARIPPRVQGRHLVRQGRHGRAEHEVEDHRRRPATTAKEFEQQYNDGLITQGEKYNKVVDAWSKATDQIADEMMKQISSVERSEGGREAQVNSIYMMAHSGARGSPAQMRQLAGMRGLMAKPSGEIIESPIISNFKEGLTVLEYFNSTHGARKGLADTALKTANSGYLTRRLVDVAQDCIITTVDCGTTAGIKVRAIIDAGTVVASLASRILGRTTAEDVRDPSSHKVIVKGGTLLEEPHVEAIMTAGVQELRIRSVLTCETTTGVCGMCYGRDLARGTPVNMGEAVGVIAAQSIGEPGTQLTMRTFHIGGAAQISEQSFVESNFDGTIKIKNKNMVKNSDGQTVAMVRNMVVAVLDPDGTERRCTASNMVHGS
jgi:DNA-directed RNA polymerase subunit beta'